MLFGRKKISQRVKEDKEAVERNYNSVGALLLLCDDEKTAERLKCLSDALKYLIPTDADEVLRIDKKIGNKLGDLRIELSKYGGSTSKKTSDLIMDIELSIADRKIYV